MSMRRLGLFTLVLWASGCTSAAPGSSVARSSPDKADAAPETGAQWPSDAAADVEGIDVAPTQLVVDGQYSDERFLDMMSAHHAMATVMASVEVQHGTHPVLVQLARGIIAAQTSEIDEMRQMKQRLYGTPRVTLQTSQEEMDNSGMLMPEQLAQQFDIDRAFLDSMIPHHSGAIRMAGVAALQSHDASILKLARSIIDAQAQEIGKMIGWRLQWFGDGPYVRPHSGSTRDTTRPTALPGRSWGH
jgi:uncharacterized protein (DUF305 family)